MYMRERERERNEISLINHIVETNKSLIIK